MLRGFAGGEHASDRPDDVDGGHGAGDHGEAGLGAVGLNAQFVEVGGRGQRAEADGGPQRDRTPSSCSVIATTALTPRPANSWSGHWAAISLRARP